MHAQCPLAQVGQGFYQPCKTQMLLIFNFFYIPKTSKNHFKCLPGNGEPREH